MQIIMLDTRFFLDKSKGTVLGEQQWVWLGAQLASQDVNLRFIISSFQVLGNKYETWSNTAQADLSRLWNLLDAKNARNVILVSGDRHIGGFYKVSENSDVKTPPLLEVTSSSLTHTWATAPPEPGETRIPGHDLVRENHFAQFDIDWEAGEVTVSMIPVGAKDPAQVIDSISVSFSQPTCQDCLAACAGLKMKTKKTAHRGLLLRSTTPLPPTCESCKKECKGIKSKKNRKACTKACDRVLCAESCDACRDACARVKKRSKRKACAKACVDAPPCICDACKDECQAIKGKKKKKKACLKKCNEDISCQHQ